MDLQIDFAHLDLEFLHHRRIVRLDAIILDNDLDRVITCSVRGLVDRGGNTAQGFRTARMVREPPPCRGPTIGFFIEDRDFLAVKSTFTAANQL